ncbi:hypothetical protein [Paraburkholderia sp. BL9I2N2]|uniref:hypothetical protein n=1 Tax=Paraburkholderia sp. BL9I2N2 TaxID=1938809 RepID=UPI00104B22F8|nr:hypothetical protein [Paraburkholderia sp. BL9I2N2]TCK87366.1 hypothetical protein B0G74_7905 [Paraburkholderia sp. BL9I2N2]
MVIAAFLLVLCAITMPPQITFAVFIAMALARILYLTRDSAIDAAAQVITSPVRLVADIRRNGMEVLRTIAGYSVIIAILCGIAFLCSLV